ncbi:sigma-54 dependent transcriptional regulator [Bowmanella sp. Y26]|uniref:sigma-54-dependent transcriptional regulator n=1 Tax=Bowmanella yangjiangensis TaxID=2811230 RepID=UPI001BDC9B60|nr:sigma-54 dependent transcriptional regulator [Bowmanella yangjiangensis]MBT1062467.1 sigma-54 dependent transcriptional regulator [Bowmanella yangjiangensis]
MLQDGRILIVDDDQDILVAGKMLLKRHFSQIDICNRPEQIPVLLAESRYDAILLDMNFGPGESSGEQGYRWLEKILAIDPQAVVIMITAHGDMEVAVEAMKRGATDFVAKPWHNNKVLATVSSAVKLSHSRTEASELRTANNLLAEVTSQSSQPIIAGSDAMRQALNLLERSAPTDANVLILGENGTGKELIARAIHGQSPRHHKVFMSVDLGAVAESLFESELFGHRKGAFTGANEDRTGRLLAADGGTLFLDEIGNLPLHLQAKLLTVLAQRQVTPLGSNQAKSFDVRVIAATNLPLEQLHDEQRFRQDLLFRLNTVEIHLPALRERQEDIAAIAEYYLKHYCRKYQKPAKQLSLEAMVQLQAYHWPGNIRELRHALERAVILSEHQTLDATDFQLSNRAMVPTVQPEVQTFNLEELERQAVEGALKTHRYNISHAAKALGLTRAALYRRMEKHGL